MPDKEYRQKQYLEDNMLQYTPQIDKPELDNEQPTVVEKSAATHPPFPERYRGKFLRYLESGFKVVPVKIVYINGKKHPAFPASWKTHRFSYADCKPCHNGLFIVTGSASKLMVVDFDRKGEKLDMQLKIFGIDIRRYSHCWTPSGGLHIYFGDMNREYWLKRYSRTTLTTANPALGIDIRHDNAGVFAPGTEIPGYGKYTWVIPPYDPQALAYDIQKLTPLMDAIFAPPVAVEKRQVIPTPSAPASYEDDYQRADALVSALAGIKLDYSDWIKVGMALYSAFGERGKTLWDNFLNNPHYHDSSQKLNTHWRSFAGNKVGFGSLVYVAEKYGIRI